MKTESPRAIAARVPKPSAYIAAIAALSAKQAEAASALADLQNLNARCGSEQTPPTGKEIQDANARLNDLRDAERALIREIEAHRPKHIAAIRAAMSPIRNAQARRALAAIEELASSQSIIEETSAAIIDAGGSAVRLPPAPFIEGVAKIARKILAETGKA